MPAAISKKAAAPTMAALSPVKRGSGKKIAGDVLAVLRLESCLVVGCLGGVVRFALKSRLRAFRKSWRALLRRTWLALTPPAKMNERASGCVWWAIWSFSRRMSQAVD